MLTVELTPTTEPKKREIELLTSIANEAHVDDWHNLRWFAVGGDNPRSIVVCKRGKKAQTVCTISKTNNPSAWASWLPVLEELQTEKRKTNRKRISHKKLQTGKL